MDTQVQYSSSRAHIGSLIQSVTRLRDIADRMVRRSVSLSADMASIASELRYHLPARFISVPVRSLCYGFVISGYTSISI